MIILGTNSIKDTGYDVANSLRFNKGSSDSLTRTPSGAGNRKTFTFSTWFKKGDFGGSEEALLYSEPDSNNYTAIRIDGSDKIRVLAVVSGGTSSGFDKKTTRVFRDSSAWYHIVVAFDTTQSTANDRIKIYVNGVLETAFDTNGFGAAQNFDTNINATSKQEIGMEDSVSFFGGYLAETVLIDGSQLAPTSFGEFDEDSGIWKPIDVSGLTFGTNGFYLDFEDSGALGDDVSGNGNDFTVNNLTAIDQTTDTPTNNFATLNPLNVPTSNPPTFSEGNLKSVTSSVGSARFGGSSTIGVTQGKWYVEAKATVDSTVRNTIGVCGEVSHLALNNEDIHENSNSSFGYDAGTGDKFVNGAQISYGNSYTTGDIIGIALDLDNNKLYFSKNGTFQNSGVPTSGATGTGAISITAVSSTTDGAYFFAQGDNTGGSFVSTFEFNFGAGSSFAISSGNTDGNDRGNFEYAVPSGYYSLNTKNLAEYG